MTVTSQSLKIIIFADPEILAMKNLQKLHSVIIHVQSESKNDGSTQTNLNQLSIIYSNNPYYRRIYSNNQQQPAGANTTKYSDMVLDNKLCWKAHVKKEKYIFL